MNISNDLVSFSNTFTTSSSLVQEGVVLEDQTFMLSIARLSRFIINPAGDLILDRRDVNLYIEFREHIISGVCHDRGLGYVPYQWRHIVIPPDQQDAAALKQSLRSVERIQSNVVIGKDIYRFYEIEPLVNTIWIFYNTPAVQTALCDIEKTSLQKQVRSAMQRLEVFNTKLQNTNVWSLDNQ